MQLIKTKSLRTSSNTFIRNALFSSLLISSPHVLFGAPKEPHQIHGDVSFSGTEQNTLIHAKDGAIIHWKEFSIGKGESVQFIQPNADATTLNRVTGGKLSEIHGLLSANGRVVLVNPSGIYIGKEGVIRTAGFIASTLDLSKDLFGKDKHLHFKGDSKQGVINMGRVESEQGDIMLIGFQVENRGELSAPKGLVSLAAASEVLIKPAGHERIFIKASVKQPDSEKKEGASVTQAGNINSLSTEIKADGNAFKFGIQNSGIIEATGIVESGGNIYLVAENGVTSSSGDLIAKLEGDNSTQKGGEIHLFGDRVHLIDSAVVDASGDQQGGRVLIGGAFQGVNSPYGFNSQQTFIGPEVLIDVSAKLFGNAGKTIIWSDNSTNFKGTVMGEGGRFGGNGAFVEVSGKGHLNYEGQSFLLPHHRGEAGTLLLDPIEINIKTAASSAGVFPANDPNPFTLPSQNSVVIDHSTIMNALNTGSVIISTAGPSSTTGTGDINIDANAGIFWFTSNALTLLAERDINIRGDAVNHPSSGGIKNMTSGPGGNISLHAQRSINVESAVFSYNGTSSSAITSLKADTGDITIDGTNGPALVGNRFGQVIVDAPMGDVTLKGGSSGTGYYAVIGNSATGINGGTGSGNITVKAGKNLQILGGGSLESYAAITRVGVKGLIGDGVNGNIDLLVGKDTLINGGSAPLAQAFVGHGGFGNTTTSSPIVGDVEMHIGGNLELRSGNGADSFIGTAAAYNNTQDITLVVGKNLYMHHDVATGGAKAYIGANEASNAQFRQNLFLTVGENATLDARNGGRVTLQPMNGFANNPNSEELTPQGLIQLRVGGDLQMISGNQDNSFATIFLYNAQMTTDVLVGGNIRTYNGLQVDSSFPIPHAPNSDLGKVSIKALGNIILGGGNMSDCPIITSRFHSYDQPILIEADATFASGTLWNPQVKELNGNNIFAGTKLEIASSNKSTTDNQIVGGNGFGAVAFDTAKYSPDFTSYPSSVTGFVNASAPDPLFSAILPAEHPVSYTTGSSFTLYSSDTFADGQTVANLLIGDGPFGSHVAERNFLNAHATDNLTISGHPLVDANSCISKGMVANGYASITLNPNRSLSSTNGSILLVANGTIALEDGSTLTAGNDLTLVVDNKFPGAVGTGKLIKDETATLTAGGHLRLFTAGQSLNTIAGELNGLTFVAAPEFTETAREKYGAFYCDNRSADNYILFYKQVKSPTPIPRPALQNNPGYELFIYLGGTEVTLSWDEEFAKSHDTNSYNGVKVPGSTSSFDVSEANNFFLRRKSLRMFNPKSYKTL